MTEIGEKLDKMEEAIKKPSFRQSSGKANEVNYWVFDYPPECELEVRERIEYLQSKNRKGTDGFTLVVFDLYDIISSFSVMESYSSKLFAALIALNTMFSFHCVFLLVNYFLRTKRAVRHSPPAGLL